MKKLFIPALCAVLFTFTGCVNSFNEDDHIATQPAIMESVTLEGDLADDIRITQTSKMKTEQGIEVVCIRGRLKRDGFCKFVLKPDSTVNLAYKFTWFDAQGKEITVPAYKCRTLTLKPGEEFALVSHAPAKDIVNVKLVIRSKDACAQPCAKTCAAKKAPAAAKAPVATPEAPAAVPAKKASVKTNCLCGCAAGNPCYCPEGSACPNAGKNTKK